MSVATARVPASAHVPWTILSFVLRLESADLKPSLEDLIRQFARLREEVAPLVTQLEDLGRKIEPLLEEALTFQDTFVPLWEDTYALCGRRSCTGTCRVCLEGETIEEVDEGEKYCRRGRR